MAKKKRPKGRKGRMGKRRSLPHTAAAYVRGALKGVRAAKLVVEAKTPEARRAWAELHHVESRLSRLV